MAATNTSPYFQTRNKTLLQSMTGQNPYFSPTDPMPGDLPAFGQPLDPSLGVTASSLPTANSGGSSAPTLPANYNFNDLADYETKVRNAFGQNASADILKTRDSLSKSLSDYGQQFFDQQNPAILEDLNKRGLLDSPTAVNQGQANALKDITLSNESYLRDFDTSALSARLQAAQDAIDSASNLRSTGLESNLQDAQARREENLANQLADKQSRNSLTNSLIGVGGQLGGTLLLGKMLAPKAAAATLAAPTVAGAGTTAAGTAGAAGATGIGSFALPAAGVAAGAGLFEETRKRLEDHGYGKNEAKIVASMPLANIPYIGGKALLNEAGFGAGHTENGNAIAATAASLQSQRGQLFQLKQALDAGQIDPATYDQETKPIIQQYHQMVNSALSQGSVWASSIKPEWQALQDAGIVKAQNGQWVTNTGQVFWDPSKGWNV